MPQAVEHLPSKCEALSSIPITTKKERKKKKPSSRQGEGRRVISRLCYCKFGIQETMAHRPGWLMPEVLAIWKADIRRITV
jgi:hypothetical protein